MREGRKDEKKKRRRKERESRKYRRRGEELGKEKCWKEKEGKRR